MSNLKLLFFLTCILLCSSPLLIYGQTLTITPDAPVDTYTPSDTKSFTFTLDGIADVDCLGEWSLTATSTSNYLGFPGEVMNEAIDLGGSGSVGLPFNTPASGELTITAIATQPVGCAIYPDGIEATPVILTASVTIEPEVCDADDAFLEDFQGVDAGTGFSGNPPSPTPPVVVGQGTANLGTADFKDVSFFEVQENGGNKRMVASNFQNGEVFWESDIISVSPCCARTISVDIFGEGGARGDYVRVFTTINGGAEFRLGGAVGAPNSSFSETLSVTTCDIPAITSPSDLRIIVRVRPSNKAGDFFGFDNVQVSEGTPVGVPQILNIDCTPVDASTTTLTVSAVSECTPEYSLDGISWQDENTFTVNSADPGNTILYTVYVRDQRFSDCGEAVNEVTVDENGSCTYVFPIELLDFYGRAEADAIGLYWSTATEIDNDYMAVERSLNGIDFEEIGRVAGKGTTSERQDYTFVDNYPVSGTNYYRLRQVDFDGSTEYHPVISVLFDKPATFFLKVSPNPAKDILQVDWSLPGRQDGMLRVFDIQGRRMSQREMGQGSGRYNLPINNLPSGVYLLQLVQNGQTEWLRFVKE